MKTSASQFEMLVNFMEQNGDINKLNKNAKGRIQTIQDWERLTNLLNSDPTGETKNTEIWKKVWSDLKNNTKKKAAKINRAVGGTGGGPALNLQLTDLEQRVLNIILPQAATGLTGVREAGFSENRTDSPNRTLTLSPTPPVLAASYEVPVIEESPVIHIIDYDTWNEAGPSQITRNEAEPSHITTPLPQPSPTTNTYQAQVEEEIVLDSPPLAGSLRPTQAGYTPQRRRRGITSRRIISPRRRVIRQPNQMERATEQFLNSDEEWRSFLRKKQEDDYNIEREKLRIRELELDTHRKWQDVALLAVEALNKVIDSRLCRDQ